jgi:hypothetical protein
MEYAQPKIRTARKPRQCDWCLDTIEPGQKYNHLVSFECGDVYEWNTHIHCQNLFEANRHCDGCEGIASDCQSCFLWLMRVKVCPECYRKDSNECPKDPRKCCSAQGTMERLYGGKS